MTPPCGAAGIGWRVGGAQILDDVTLEVRRGELVGVIGPNGAGKSSLVNIFSGTLRPTTGRVILGGAGRHAAGRPPGGPGIGLARSFQTSALFDGLPACGERPPRAAGVRGGASSPLPVRPPGR